MKIKILHTGACALLINAAFLHAGTFNILPWTGDGDSGISALTNYTAVADFAGDGTRSINGVNFTSITRVGTSGSSYLLDRASNTFFGDTNNLSGGSGQITADFFYSGGSGFADLTLGNLIAGQTYTTTWYNTGFGPIGGRVVTIIPGDTGTPFTYDANLSGDNNGHLLTYTFVAQGPSITFAFDAANDFDSYHHYALTNAGPSAGAAPLALSTPTYAAFSQVGGPFAPFTVSNTDLLQTAFGGIVASTGNFTLEGTGGIPVLANGAFSITGITGNNPELATGQNNASITIALDLTNASFGFDITQIVGYGGWNDAGRDRQLYNLYYSTIGDSGFTLIGGADFDPGAVTGISAVSATFNTALTGVDQLRIDFLNGQENGHAGYGEFDVFGTATVPESASAALLLFGGVLGLRRRRG
jgi:hypothetical protein